MSELRLNRAPTVANAPLFAADVIEAAAKISGVLLDYSVESLQAVDDLFEAMRRDGMTTAKMGKPSSGSAATSARFASEQRVLDGSKVLARRCATSPPSRW